MLDLIGTLFGGHNSFAKFLGSLMQLKEYKEGAFIFEKINCYFDFICQQKFGGKLGAKLQNGTGPSGAPIIDGPTHCQ